MRSASSSSMYMMASVRGGRSRATSDFIRRSTNGRIRSRGRAAAARTPCEIGSPPRRAEARGGGGVALRDRLAPALLEGGAAAEQAGVGEVELAPQLVEPVLDRRAGQGDLPLGLEPVRGA